MSDKIETPEEDSNGSTNVSDEETQKTDNLPDGTGTDGIDDEPQADTVSGGSPE